MKTDKLIHMMSLEVVSVVVPCFQDELWALRLFVRVRMLGVYLHYLWGGLRAVDLVHDLVVVGRV